MKIIVSSEEEKELVSDALYWIERYINKSGVDIFPSDRSEEGFDKLYNADIEVEKANIRFVRKENDCLLKF